MEGRGRKSGKGSRENKTCKSKNMSGAAQVVIAEGTVQHRPGGSQSGPCDDSGALCPPVTFTHIPHGQPHAGPPRGAGPAPAGLVAVSGSGLGQQSWSCSQAQVTPYPQDNAALGGPVWYQSGAPPGLGCPTAKPCPAEHNMPQSWGHPVSPGWTLLPCSSSSVLCFSTPLWRRDVQHGISLVLGAENRTLLGASSQK